MAMKPLQEVKPGSTVRLNGVDYVVKQNSITDLVLERGTVGGIKASGVYRGAWRKHETAIEVVKEPTTQADLTASFRAQMTQPKESLADSFRRQMAQPQAAPVGREVPLAETAQKAAQQAVGKVDIKVNAVNAKVDSLRGAAAQAVISAADAKTIARDVAHALEGFAFETDIRLGSVEQSIETLEETVEEVAETADAAQDAVADLSQRLARLEQERNQERFNKSLENQPKSQGGNKTMKNLLGNFKGLFGKVEGQFALSIFGGIAIRKAPFSKEWITYDAASGAITDVQENVLQDLKVPAFRLPVAQADIQKGDIVVNNGAYQYVTAVADGYVNTVNPASASKGTVLPIRNPILNQAFYTAVKVIDFTAGATGAGGFNPMLLMALDGKGDKDSLLPLLLASGGLNGQAGAIDPMMLAFLSDSADDVLPLILMQQGGLTKDGFNPLLLLALDQKDGKGKDLLPLLLMGQGGGDIQKMLPFLLMSGDGGDMKDLIMMQALTGQNLFGGNTTPAANATNDANK